MCAECYSDKELLIELEKRIKEKRIICALGYYYTTGELALEMGDSGDNPYIVKHRQNVDIDNFAFLRNMYVTCLENKLIDKKKLAHDKSCEVLSLHLEKKGLEQKKKKK
jgi:hypothetical protein